MNTFADLLKEYRLARGLSQNQLGKRCGYTPGFVSYLETGSRNPRRDTVDTIARGLDATPEERDRLMAAAGYLPRSLASLLHEPSLAELDDLIAASSEPLADDVRAVVRVVTDYARRAYAGQVVAEPSQEDAA